MKRTEDIHHYYVDFFERLTLDEVIEKLNNLKEIHKDKYKILKFRSVYGFGEEADRIILYGTREETETEKDKRLLRQKKQKEKENKIKEAKEAREKEQYEKLKKKFGG